MGEELQNLIKEQEQLRSMRQSVMDFEKKLNDKTMEFFSKYLGFKEGESFSMIDIVAKVRSQID